MLHGFYLFFDYFCDIMKESMEDNKSQLLNYSIYASLFLGIFWIIKYLLANFANLQFLNSFLSIGTPIVLYYFLTRYNKIFTDNKISFGHGVQFSILLFFFASIWESVVVFIHVNWVDPAHIANLYNNLVEVAQSINLSEALTTQLINQPLPTAFSFVFSNVILADVFIGLLLSLLIVPLVRYLVTRKEDNLID